MLRLIWWIKITLHKGESDSSEQWHHWLMFWLWSTMPTPVQWWTKLKISHKDILISVFTPSRLHLLSKISWASVFLRIFFAHIHLMRCLSSMVNLIAVTDFYWRPDYIVASKEYLRKMLNVFALRISISLAILSEIFI